MATVVRITPTYGPPVPAAGDGEPCSGLSGRDACVATANTVDALEALGAEIPDPLAGPVLPEGENGVLDLPGKKEQEAATLFDFAPGDAARVATILRSNGAMTTSLPEAAAIRTMVHSLGFSPFQDVAVARNYVTNRLLQLSTSSDEKIALRALELLGKHHDIGLFTERSEVTVHHTNAAELENSIRERIKRLSKAEIIDAVPSIRDLDPDATAADMVPEVRLEPDREVVRDFLKDLGLK